MALEFNINIKNSQALAALDTLQNRIKATTGTFDKLKGAFAGLAIGAAIKNVIAFSDAVNDLSEATGIAVNKLLGFQSAVTAFGGNAESADKAILKLTTNIGEAANGSATLQDAFGRVGVSLEDLRTLSEEQILAKTLEGFSRLTNVSDQMIVKQQLLGKEFRKVKTDGLAEAYKDASVQSEKYAESIRKAAAAQDAFDVAAKAAKLALVDMIEPFTKFIGNMKIDEINAFVGGLVKLGTVLAVVYGWFVLLGKAAAIAAEIGGVIGTLLAFATGIGEVAGAIALVIAGLYAMNEGIKLAFKVDIIDSFIGKVKDAYSAVKEFAYAKFPSLKPESTAGAGRGGNDELTKQQQAQGEAMRKAAEAQKAAADAARVVTDAFAKQRLAIQQASEEFAKANKNILDQINLDNSLIGTTKAYQDVTKAQAELTKRTTDEIDKLRDAKAKLSAEEQRAGLGGEYDKQIKKVEELAAAESKRLRAAIDDTQRLEMAEKLRLFGIQDQIDFNKELQNIQDDIAKSTMSEIEKKYYDIDRAAKDSAQSAIEAEKARIGRKLDTAEVKAYYDAAIKGTESLKKAQADAYSKSREFSTGWKGAFKEYVDNATNAANIARNIFQKATKGMEDALVKFAQTGKFEWKDFVNMMGEELLRSSIQATMASILGGVGKLFGGGGAGAGGGNGAGATPNNPVYVYDMAAGDGAGMPGGAGGEKGAAGGGLWESAKKVFGGITDSIGGLFGGGKQEDPMGDFINQLPAMQDSGGGGILDSISGLFDGWFANGGTIGAGKFGVVGENGPELVSGPGTVTPMGGGANVTYNINAVDAMSFKQMLAQDPSFIYALSMQGAGGVPSRR